MENFRGRGAIRVLIAAVALANGAAIGFEAVAVTGRVIDETGAPVRGAVVTAAPTAQPGHNAGSASSDAAGIFRLTLPANGHYAVRAERDGYFVFTNPDLELNADGPVEIRLAHLKELAESVDVNYSPPVIDPQQTSDSERLNNEEILNIPFPAQQDYRSALPLMTGVIQDSAGQIHFNGGTTNETNYRLNGFDVSDPASGNLNTRLNVDTVQTLEWDSSRFSPEKGKGSAGTLDIKTEMGDDHFRFNATNFIPGLGFQNGAYLNHWSPRVIFSGPIRKHRAWFHNSFDTYYTADTVSGLPAGQNRTHAFTGSELMRLQWNISDAQILTASFLLNLSDSVRAGLSFLTPASTTTNRRGTLFLGAIKDQFMIGGGLIEIGFADTHIYSRTAPQGDAPYVITPFGASGNYFQDQTSNSMRQEWILNGFIRPLHAKGTHQIQLGANVERSSLDQIFDRRNFDVVGVNNVLVRNVQFLGAPLQFRSNIEVYGYAVDKWNPSPTLTLEAGLRTQWDEYSGGSPAAPRLAAAWAPKRLGGTKFSAGWGLFYDPITLGQLALGQEQTSISTFYAPDGSVSGLPIYTRFALRPGDVRLPRFSIASFSVEQRLPWNVYARANLIDREGNRGLTFVNTFEALDSNVYLLSNVARQRYRAAEFIFRRTFLSKYEWSASYTRSSAWSSAAVNYTIENPVFSPQEAGPLGWDARNRFLIWGWAPVEKTWFPHFAQRIVGDTDLQVMLDYRNGFPFTATTETGYIVGGPNGYRFPDYATLNLGLERKFAFRGFLWAGRVAVVNVLDRLNSNVVNADYNSPQFLTFYRGQARAINFRLRLLGRK
jgi:hypothetical protein